MEKKKRRNRKKKGEKEDVVEVGVHGTEWRHAGRGGGMIWVSWVGLRDGGGGVGLGRGVFFFYNAIECRYLINELQPIIT